MAFSAKQGQIPHRQLARGSATVFFCAIVLGVIVLFISLSVDTSVLFLNADREQSILDSAALLAGKHLPFIESAEEAALNYVREFSPYVHGKSEREGSIGFQASANEVRVSLTITEEPIFGAMFLRFWGKHGDEAPKVRYSLTSHARVNPRDVIIFVDTSSFVAPDINGTDFWSKPLMYGHFTLFRAMNIAEVETFSEFNDLSWGAASFFMPEPELTEFNYSERGDDASRAVIRTQQCFNPHFSALKQGAIHLYDYLSAFTDNRIAVIVGPAEGGGVYVVRELLPSDSAGAGSGATLENAPRPAGVRDIQCMAAAELAEQELHGWAGTSEFAPHRARFAFPAMSRFLEGGAHTEAQLVTRNEAGQLDFRVEGPSDLTVRHAVWSLAVNPHRVVSLPAVIRGVRDRIESGLAGRVRRTGEQQVVTTTAYIFLGDYPQTSRVGAAGGGRGDSSAVDGGAVRGEVLDSLRDLDTFLNASDINLMMYIMVPRLDTRYPGCNTNECEAHYEDSQAFQEGLGAFVRGDPGEGRRLAVLPIRVPDPGSLVQDLISILPQTDRAILLSRGEGT